MKRAYTHRARLVLGEPQAVYYAGQELTGYIQMEIDNPIQFSAINVTFHGEARTHWTESETEEYNGIQRTREVEYNGGQECLHYTQCLYGMTLPGRGEGLIDVSSLPPGDCEIPFKFVLPQDIPSSFKSERGHITYNVTAYVDYVDRSMGRDELYHEFEVVAPMNLLQDDIVCPLEMHFEEVYSCWCSSSPMNIDIKCPVSGYCPGQAIPINIKVKNESAAEVKKIVFKLVKKVLYRSQEPPSEYTTPDEVLATIKTGAILSNSDKGFTCHLPVPAMIAPNMDNCDVIDIGFFLRATIKMTGCNDDLEDEVLLFIGLKPIPGTPGSENYVHPLAPNLPNGAPVSEPPLRANIEQIAPNSSSYPDHGAPYPAHNVRIVPIQLLNSPNTPYPTESSQPIAPSHHMSSYPGPNPPPYPTSNGSNSAPSKHLSSYPGQNPPPYPTSNGSNPSGLELYPPPRPMGIAPPYPAPTGYPSPVPPNPSSRSTSPYPTQNSPYPSANPPYQSANPPYPSANSPFPPANSADPSDSTNSTTVSISMSTLRTQNLGFVLPTGSPYPPKNDDPNSPYTPLMKNYSPSAPPPST